MTEYMKSFVIAGIESGTFYSTDNGEGYILITDTNGNHPNFGSIVRMAKRMKNALGGWGKLFYFLKQANSGSTGKPLEIQMKKQKKPYVKVEMLKKMLRYYKPENIVFLGFSSGAAHLLDIITYINELNDGGESFPMPGLLIPISPGSVPVTDDEKAAIARLDKRDIMIPAEYMYTAREIMCHGREVPEKYLATAHGDFRNAPKTHFYYGTAETLYAFAPSYAESYRKAGAKCIIHVGKGMHHCYALQYFIPGCKPAFNEVMQLIRNYFRKGANI